MPVDYRTTLYDSQSGSGQGARGRRWFFCSNVVDVYNYDELIQTCASCGRFSARCCHHNIERDPEDPSRFVDSGSFCHHFRVIYTDGACLNNGIAGASQSAGLGIAMGTDDEDQWAIPVDDKIDPQGPRTSQRTELLAAIEGVRIWAKLHRRGCRRRLQERLRRWPEPIKFPWRFKEHKFLLR